MRQTRVEAMIVLLAGVCALGLAVAPCLAVVVHGDDAANQSDPAGVAGFEDFEYWNNIGVMGPGTGVYLYNGWALTARHVGIRPLTIQGMTYSVDSSVGAVTLLNPDSTPTDLRLIKLLDVPALPAMSIAQNTVGSNDPVLAVGASYDRAAEATVWSVDASTIDWVWTTPAIDPPYFTGYLTEATRGMTWGTNEVATTTTLQLAGGGLLAQCFNLRFDSSGTTYESQAVSGDSGGPIFRQGAEGWDLAGMTLTTLLTINQPQGNRSAILDFNWTSAADLTVYRDQIMDILGSIAVPGDMNDDGETNSLDVPGFVTAITNLELYQQMYPDVDVMAVGDLDGSGNINLLDICPFISLITGGGGSAADVDGLLAVPEPGTLGLLIFGGLALMRCRL